MLHHLDLNVSDLPRSRAFYELVLGRLGWTVGEEGAGWVVLRGEGTYLTLVATPRDHLAAGYHRKRTGLNHLAFGVATPEDVHAFARFPGEHGIPLLYGGVLTMGERNVAAFFEDPDRVKLEVVYKSFS